MELFILDMKHLPDMCPMFNPEVKHTFFERSSHMEEVAAKLDVKIVLNMGVAIEHNIIMVLEAPSVQAVENFIMEMQFSSFNVVNLRHAQYSEDIMKKL
ncbi:hypothetical protein FGU46_10465 [Methanobacterium sp. CWC-01]|uniref:hypothetical protein n=1 Tax=Methanobacterium aridiramus TaxID=2584467 RepID=UPI002574CF50|nr:hypothetical protein [Methanobacterium sp. CWC-01]WJI10482.1 hypothetical protein FGU46_10465 [Methanobacterium sp. CWC-01]